MRDASTLVLLSRPARCGGADTVEITLSPAASGCELIAWRGHYIGSLHSDGQLYYAQDLNGQIYCGLFAASIWWLLDRYVQRELDRAERAYGGAAWSA